jgi:hypothetical protein
MAGQLAQLALTFSHAVKTHLQVNENAARVGEVAQRLLHLR